MMLLLMSISVISESAALLMNLSAISKKLAALLMSCSVTSEICSSCHYIHPPVRFRIDKQCYKEPLKYYDQNFRDKPDYSSPKHTSKELYQLRTIEPSSLSCFQLRAIFPSHF